jgi:hypothetical protein
MFCVFKFCVLVMLPSFCLGCFPRPRPTPIDVWQWVAMDSLEFHPGPPCPTLLRPAGGPPMKRPYVHFWGGPPSGRAACGRLLPLWPPHAVRHNPSLLQQRRRRRRRRLRTTGKRTNQRLCHVTRIQRDMSSGRRGGHAPSSRTRATVGKGGEIGLETTSKITNQSINQSIP